MFQNRSDELSAFLGATDLRDTPVYPPRGILHVAASVLLVDSVLLAAGADLVHWVGYAIAAFAAPIIVLLYRHVTITRSTKPLFVGKPGQARLAAALLGASIALSAFHAFLALQETVIR